MFFELCTFDKLKCYSLLGLLGCSTAVLFLFSILMVSVTSNYIFQSHPPRKQYVLFIYSCVRVQRLCSE